jgi:MFS family permease
MICVRTGSVFYLGYLVFAYPHNRFMQMLPVNRYLSVTVIIWGAVLMLHAVCTRFAALMAIRFILGALEGCATSGCVLLVSRFYAKDEHALRVGAFYTGNAFAQMAGAAVAFGISSGFAPSNNLSLAGWKALFVLTGGMTIVYGSAMLKFLANTPLDARWLSREEKHLAIERLRVNHQGIGTKIFKWSQVREAFTDPRVRSSYLLTASMWATANFTADMALLLVLHNDANSWWWPVCILHAFDTVVWILRSQHAPDQHTRRPGAPHPDRVLLPHRSSCRQSNVDSRLFSASQHNQHCCDARIVWRWR